MINLGHIGIHVSDLATSERFYLKALNGKTSGRIETDEVRIGFLQVANGVIELVQFLKDGTPVSHGSSPHLAFEVGDIDSEYSRIRSLGAQLIDPNPRAFSGGKLFFFKGPDGESVEFYAGIRAQAC